MQKMPPVVTAERSGLSNKRPVQEHPDTTGLFEPASQKLRRSTGKANFQLQ